MAIAEGQSMTESIDALTEKVIACAFTISNRPEDMPLVQLPGNEGRDQEAGQLTCRR
jgi:hypothetical protein